MTQRKEAIQFCLTLPDSYEDYPFHDPNMTVIRLTGSRKVFAWIFERQGHVWINLKMDPEWREFWRNAFPSIIPAYHLNKQHWSSVILDGTVPDETVKRLILESYDLVKKKRQPEKP